MNKIVKKNISANRVVLTSFLVNSFDVLVGITLSWLTGSVVMLSQALEGIADLTSTGFLAFGLSRSRKKADSNHPFGYGRELYFWTLLSALVMFAITSTFTIYFGWQRVVNPVIVHNTVLASIALVFTTLTNGYALSLSLRRILKGNSFNLIWVRFFSSSMIETKTAFILDLMGTSAAFIGLVSLIIYEVTGDVRFDGWGTITIGLTLGILSIMLLMAIKDFLIGKSVSIGTLETIKKSVYKIEHIHSIQDLKAIHMGPGNVLINIEVNARNNLTTDQLESVIDKVKDEIRKDLPSAKHIQVELESKN